MVEAAILTVSDSCARGDREDASGETIRQMLVEHDFEVRETKVIADDRDQIASCLKQLTDETSVDIIFTTGGTGLGPRDVTPEVTQAVCERMVPGLSEVIRAEGWDKTKRAVLSRGVAGIRNKTLIINLPGSPKGAKESLQTILDILPHAVEMIHGGGH
jgi:molybdenum cofactor synthesis domain-containing protein